MNGPAMPARFLVAVCFALVLTDPGEVVAWEPSCAPAATVTPAAPSARIQANKLFDYIRGNRSRMVQITTIAFGIGLVILMTATRKS